MTVEDTRRLVLTVVALGLVQLAWILAIAPFGGLDEPQHVFKAEAVARGDLSPHHSPAPDGVGQLLVVPDDIAAAAHPACVLDQSRTQAGCRGTDLGSGTRVASTAATYNPVYYAVVGAVALPFDGTAALYAMRAWSALLCGVITALAITLLVRRRRGSTLLTASLLVLSPIWAYTSVVVAPNGLEMATAFLLWGCLLRLGSTDPLPLPRRWLVVLATSSAALLVTLRTLGPLWCAVIVVVCAVVADPGRLRSAVAAPGARRAAALVGGCAVAAVTWSVVAGTNSVAQERRAFAGSPWYEAAARLTQWAEQSVAAFPFRNEFAAPIVYLVVFAMWVVAAVHLVRVVRGRELLTWVALLAVVVGVPFAFTVLTWSANGDVWQGRYGYPVTMGLMLLGGSALARHPSGPTDRRTVPMAWVVTGGLVLATGVSFAGVLHRQQVSGVPFGALGPHGPPLWLLVALSAAGLCALTAVLGTVARDVADADTPTARSLARR